ncbi:TatD family hydrolase, partial [Vibrio parahaemolyticus]
ANGFYFSINYAMTLSDNGKKIIERIPIDRLLLETDGPFIVIEKKPSTPLNISQTLTNLISIKISQDDKNVTSNFVFENF